MHHSCDLYDLKVTAGYQDDINNVTFLSNKLLNSTFVEFFIFITFFLITSTRAILENYTPMESKFGSLEHDLYKLIEFWKINRKKK